MAFYRIVEKAPPKTEEEEEEEETAPATKTIIPREPIACPGDDNKVIEKGAVGFRFVGDLYDRYWTCNVALFMPSGAKDFSQELFADRRSFNLSKPSGVGNKNTTHSQRKILEAKMFENATAIIADEAENILRSVSSILGEDVS